MTNATLHSDNTVYAQMTLDVGPGERRGDGAQAGRPDAADDADGAYVPSMGLGSIAVSPLDMASAYATLAAGGVYSKPMAIRKVVLSSGKVDTDAGWGKPHRTRVIPDWVADDGDEGARAEHAARHGHRRVLRPAGRGQDRHDRQLRRRLVLRLHADPRGDGLDRLRGRRDPDDERPRDRTSRARRFPATIWHGVHGRAPSARRRTSTSSSRRTTPPFTPFKHGQYALRYVPSYTLRPRRRSTDRHDGDDRRRHDVDAPAQPPPTSPAPETHADAPSRRSPSSDADAAAADDGAAAEPPPTEPPPTAAAADGDRPPTPTNPVGPDRPVGARAPGARRARARRRVLRRGRLAGRARRSSPLHGGHPAGDPRWAWIFLALRGRRRSSLYLRRALLAAAPDGARSLPVVVLAVRDPARAARRAAPALDRRLDVLGPGPDRGRARREPVHDAAVGRSRTTRPSRTSGRRGATRRPSTGPAFQLASEPLALAAGRSADAAAWIYKALAAAALLRRRAARRPARAAARRSPPRSSAGTRCSRSTSRAAGTTTRGWRRSCSPRSRSPRRAAGSSPGRRGRAAILVKWVAAAAAPAAGARGAGDRAAGRAPRLRDRGGRDRRRRDAARYGLALARRLRAARPEREPRDEVRAPAPARAARRAARRRGRAPRRAVRRRLRLARCARRRAAARGSGSHGAAPARDAVPRRLVRGLGGAARRRRGRPGRAGARRSCSAPTSCARRSRSRAAGPRLNDAGSRPRCEDEPPAPGCGAAQTSCTGRPGRRDAVGVAGLRLVGGDPGRVLRRTGSSSTRRRAERCAPRLFVALTTAPGGISGSARAAIAVVRGDARRGRLERLAAGDVAPERNRAEAVVGGEHRGRRARRAERHGEARPAARRAGRRRARADGEQRGDDPGRVVEVDRASGSASAESRFSASSGSADDQRERSGDAEQRSSGTSRSTR